jgi:hypothetical protein
MRPNWSIAPRIWMHARTTIRTACRAGESIKAGASSRTKWVTIGALLMFRKCLPLALLAACAHHARAAQPSVTVAYNPSLDSACALVRGGTIKEEWKAELASRKPEFEALWASAGPKLVAAAEAITTKPFPSEQFTVQLTLCNLPSQSIVGISVNMRYALSSFISPPVPMRYKIDTLFHELLHVFLASHPMAKSPLLEAHPSESECVRNHLHLLALQKAVLLKVKEHEALRDVVAIDGQLPGGCYKQAWALVNATDDEYLRYVAELGR